MSKFLLGLSLCFAPLFIVGCGDGGPKDVSEGAELSEIEAYKAMVAEEEAANAGADKVKNEIPR